MFSQPLLLFLYLPSLLTLPLLTTAHFLLTYPPARDFNDETITTFPCGGQSAASKTRTRVSTTSFPIALSMGHAHSAVQILLALGNDAGTGSSISGDDDGSVDDFNIVLERTFRQSGLGSFCLPEVVVPRGVGVVEGMNATVQVVTDGEEGGGLYQCADITFTSMADPPPPAGICKNGTGVTASALPAAQAGVNANGSSSTGGSSTTSSGVAGATGQATVLTVTWLGLGLVSLGAAALL